ncbi:MAG: vanadium-dependent haloperoxidase [Terracoccus sp.]
MFRTFAERSVPVSAQGLQAGFVGAAVFDAVATVEGRDRPYLDQEPAARGASVQAAAATAAYRVLVALGPDTTGSLRADYDAWLAHVTDATSRAAGVRVGDNAADTLLAARVGDGRDAPITLVTTPGPGVWDPPPTGMVTPWLGFVTPMVLPTATSIHLSGPRSLTSRAYAAEFDEVRRMGAKTGSDRTTAQTQLALFFNDNAVRQYNVALADRLTRHSASAADAARAFGLLNLSTADALITCWRSKYDVHSWRPMQAIQRADTDGNAATTAQTAWEPLVPNPPYSEYASGHACITGAFSETMASLYGADRIDATIVSAVTNTSRHYAAAAALTRDTKNARIWLGLHFRKAMDDGNRIGREVVDYVVDRVLEHRTHRDRQGDDD